MPAGRPLKFKDAAELQVGIDRYFAERIESQKPITITGLAIALNTTRELLCNYEERDEFHDTIRSAKLRVEQYAEERLYEGAATGPIFALKNFGWKDRVETDSTIKGDVQHNHSGKIDMGAELIASAIERIMGKNEKDTNDIQARPVA